MQVSLETLGTLERRLNIAVPLEEIDGEVKTRLAKVARTAKVQGFRPGKVPYKIIEQHYGPKVREDVLNDTVEKSLNEAVREQNIRIAGMPRLEPVQQQAATESQSLFQFSAVFEVYPEIEGVDFSNTSLERLSLTVGEAQVDKTIEILRKQRVHYENVAKPVANLDRVQVDYSGTLAGKSFAGGEAKGAEFFLGQGQLLPDFEHALLGMQAGEDKNFSMTFPEDYPSAEIAGKTVDFHVSLKAVAEPVLPEVDAEFAKNLGVEDGDIAKMRAEIRLNVEREVTRRLKLRLTDEVLKVVLEAATFTPPNVLVKGEVQRLIERTQHDLAKRGLNAEQMALSAENFEEEAIRRVKLGLMMGEIIKKENLYAQPEKVRRALEELAENYEDAEQVVQWHYADPQRLAPIQSTVAEENVVEWVVQQAKIIDKPISFDELMG